MQPSNNTVETFHVVGMTCGHCANAVTAEISRLEGVTRVEVDLSTGSVTVVANPPVDPAAVAAAVDEAGYQLVR